MNLCDTELERIVAASVLDTTDETFEAIAAFVDAGDFNDPTCQALYRGALAVHARGEGRTLLTVADAAGVEREAVRALWAESLVFRVPSTIAPHARKLGELGARRRLCISLTDISHRGQAPDATLDELLTLTQEATSVSQPSAPLEPGMDGLDMAECQFEYRWLVPHLLERRDRVMLTGPEGYGKSTLLRQMAVQLASGLHPFSRVTIPRCRVLVIDLENSEPQIARALKGLKKIAGERWQRGWLTVVSRQQGMNLRSRVDAQWLDSLVGHHRPDVVVLGPLYKTFHTKGRESKSDETVAEEVAAQLDRLRVRYDCALFIEAHSPHGDSGDRARWRPIGASLFLRWPEFGFGLKPLGDGQAELVTWRGVRDRDRRWPKHLAGGHLWPWEAVESKADVA